MPYSVTAIKGVPPTSRRGIAFLESDTDERVDGKLVFDGLRRKSSGIYGASLTTGWEEGDVTTTFMVGLTTKITNTALFSSGKRLGLITDSTVSFAIQGAMLIPSFKPVYLYCMLGKTPRTPISLCWISSTA
jgi:hypothetical protein